MIAVAAIVAFAALGTTTWYKFFRSLPQPASATADPRDNFLYGSVGAEKTVGMPYWIFVVLPRVFPEYMPEGGYAGLGLPWEETRETPVGFSKKTVGYVRVAGNCALCHAYSRSDGSDRAPAVFAVGPGRTAAVQSLLSFFRQCAQDPRFTAADILSEIDSWTRLSVLDRLIYRFILIPQTRTRLLQGNSVILDAALASHSQNPRAGTTFRPRLQALDTALKGAEKDALIAYLKTLH